MSAIDAYVAALRHERAGYEAAGRTKRVAAVDAELGRLGAPAAEDEATSAPETTTSRPPERAVPPKPRRG